MAIPASRFKFLDKETNVPIQDLTAITDNLIYNAPIDNIVQAAQTTLATVTDVTSALSDSIESTISEAMYSVEDMLSSDSSFSETISNIGTELSDFIPSGMDLSIPGMADSFKSMMSRITNLSASSLCDLINLALGISILSLLGNMSKDMWKRLFMIALLALLARMCNQRFNDLSNPTNTIDIDDYKQQGKSVFNDIIRVNSVGKIGDMLPKSSNPIYKTINDTAKQHNPMNVPNILRTNPNVTIMT